MRSLEATRPNYRSTMGEQTLVLFISGRSDKEYRASDSNDHSTLAKGDVEAIQYGIDELETRITRPHIVFSANSQSSRQTADIVNDHWGHPERFIVTNTLNPRNSDKWDTLDPEAQRRLTHSQKDTLFEPYSMVYDRFTTFINAGRHPQRYPNLSEDAIDRPVLFAITTPDIAKCMFFYSMGGAVLRNPQSIPDIPPGGYVTWQLSDKNMIYQRDKSSVRENFFLGGSR